MIKDIFTLKSIALAKWKNENGFIPSNGWVNFRILSDRECEILGNEGLNNVPVNADGFVSKSVNDFESQGWRLVFEGKINNIFYFCTIFILNV